MTPDRSFYRGLAVCVPAGLALWAVGFVVVAHVLAHVVVGRGVG